MNWNEYDEVQMTPQHEAERKAEIDRQFEELDDRQRRGE